MCRPYRVSPRTVAFFSCLSCLVSAHPITIPLSIENVSSPSNTECDFVGNPDIYGPGIRIGIYTQTLALFLSKYFIISQTFAIRDSLTVFTLALLIVAVVLTASAPFSPGDAIEFFLVLQILSWNCMTGMRARSTYALEALRNRERRVLSMDAMNIAALGLHVWFWFIGMEGITHNEAECKVKVFFFAETEIQGWFRVYMKAMTLITLLEHAWDLSRRLTRAWGTGLWWGREKEMREAVEGFEGWKKSRAEKEHTDLACAIRDGHLGLDTASCHSSRLSKDAINSTRIDGAPISQTWSSNTTRDDDTVYTKEARADESLQVAANRETLSLSAAEPVPAPITKPKPPAFKSQLLEDTYAGETFLQNCVSASSFAQVHKKHPRLYTLFLRLWVVPRPQLHNQTSINEPHTIPHNTPKYLDCIKSILKCMLTLTFTRHAAVVYSHLIAIRCLDPINAPYQIHAALTHSASPDVALPPPRTIALASRTLTARLPPPSARHKYTQALLDSGIHIFVIVQIELTIRWNGITGRGGFGNVGQLIPLLVGVGGLAFVVARGIEGVCTGVRVWEIDDGGRVSGSSEWERFVSAFEEWKASVEDGDREADESAQRTRNLASDV